MAGSGKSNVCPIETAQTMGVGEWIFTMELEIHDHRQQAPLDCPCQRKNVQIRNKTGHGIFENKAIRDA